MVKVKKVHLEKKGVESVLSPLECDVIRVLWKKDRAKVRDIYAVLKKNRNVALTSVAVILDRLHQKNIVSRTIENGRGGGHYIYYPRSSKQELEESVIDHTVKKLMNNFGPVAANYFYKRFSKRR